MLYKLLSLVKKCINVNGEPWPYGPSIFSRLETKKGKGISEINSIPLLLILTVDVISDEIGQDSTAKLILSTYVMRIFKQANAIQGYRLDIELMKCLENFEVP